MDHRPHDRCPDRHHQPEHVEQRRHREPHAALLHERAHGVHAVVHRLETGGDEQQREQRRVVEARGRPRDRAGQQPHPGAAHELHAGRRAEEIAALAVGVRDHRVADAHVRDHLDEGQERAHQRDEPEVLRQAEVREHRLADQAQHRHHRHRRERPRRRVRDARQPRVARGRLLHEPQRRRCGRLRSREGAHAGVRRRSRTRSVYADSSSSPRKSVPRDTLFGSPATACGASAGVPARVPCAVGPPKLMPPA